MDLLPERVARGAFGFDHSSARDVTGDDRPGHRIKPPLVKMHVGAADFARQGFEQNSPGLKFGALVFPYLEGSVGRPHPDGFGVFHTPLLITVRLPWLGHVRETLRVL